MSKSISISKQKLIEYIHSFLDSHDLIQEHSNFGADTDMVEFGVESIILLSMLTQIEEEFSVSIGLDSLESHCYVFSVNTIFDIINEI